MKKRYRKLLVFLIVSLVSFTLCVTTYAQDSTYQETKYSIKIQAQPDNPQTYEILVNDEVIIRYRSMARGLNAYERAVIIKDRMKNLGGQLVEGSIKNGSINSYPVVLVNDRLLITVTQEDCEANNSTGTGLASVWANNLKKSLNINSQMKYEEFGQEKKEDEIIKETEEEIQEDIEEQESQEAKETEEETQEGTKEQEPQATIEEQESQEIKEAEEDKKGSKNEDTDIAAVEYKMLELVNKERVQAGVKPLLMDKELVKIARLKSQDMIDKNYFAHTSPTYGDPFAMMRSFGVSFSYAGENLAGNQTVEKAHEALMNSPGHRKNILSPNYTHIGIGIIEGGPYGSMFTQLFISK